MKKSLRIVSITMLLAAGHAAAALAQSNQTPTPAQAGVDPSMARPGGSTLPVLSGPPVHNPESTVGLAPRDQPVNNINPNVAGQVIPSSQETAAHNPSILQHDHQPTLTHSFNFTAEQKRTIVEALAQDAGVKLGQDMEFVESAVLPDSVEIKPIPDRIAEAMPWVKPFSYVKAGNKIAIVNPNLRYVAAVIE